MSNQLIGAWNDMHPNAEDYRQYTGMSRNEPKRHYRPRPPEYCQCGTCPECERHARDCMSLKRRK